MRVVKENARGAADLDGRAAKLNQPAIVQIRVICSLPGVGPDLAWSALQ
jgi:hypothetical protein